MKFDKYTVRLLVIEDAGNYFQLIDKNRKRLEDFFAGTVANTRTPNEAKNFLVELIGRAEAKIFFPYGIFENESGAMIGYVHVMNFDWSIPKAEIGFFLDVDFVRKEITSRADILIIDHYFAELGFNKLFLRTHQTNTAAQALASKCGFQKEGVLRSDYKTSSGELVDLLYYGKLRSI